jgi:hypothetical protein
MVTSNVHSKHEKNTGIAFYAEEELSQAWILNSRERVQTPQLSAVFPISATRRS